MCHPRQKSAHQASPARELCLFCAVCFEFAKLLSTFSRKILLSLFWPRLSILNRDRNHETKSDRCAQHNPQKLPCDFTLVDVQASFGHVAHPSLGLLGGEGVEVVDKRRLVGDLKVPDAAVALRTNGGVLTICCLFKFFFFN